MDTLLGIAALLVAIAFLIHTVNFTVRFWDVLGWIRGVARCGTCQAKPMPCQYVYLTGTDKAVWARPACPSCNGAGWVTLGGKA